MAAATDVCRDDVRPGGDRRTARHPDEGTWFPSVTYRDEEFHYHGMGHFGGHAPDGRRPEDSVVDADQRSWEHRNLFLVGSGSFPTMGTSNPTLTLAALACAPPTASRASCAG